MTHNRSDGTPIHDPSAHTLFAELHQRAASSGRRLTLRAWLDHAETWRILHALEEAGGNRSAAARALGIGRRTLYTKMEKLGIRPAWESGGSTSGELRAAGPA